MNMKLLSLKKMTKCKSISFTIYVQKKEYWKDHVVRQILLELEEDLFYPKSEVNQFSNGKEIFFQVK